MPIYYVGGLPPPHPGDAGKVPAVIAEETGYELVEVSGASVQVPSSLLLTPTVTGGAVNLWQTAFVGDMVNPVSYLAVTMAPSTFAAEASIIDAFQTTLGEAPSVWPAGAEMSVTLVIRNVADTEYLILTRSIALVGLTAAQEMDLIGLTIDDSEGTDLVYDDELGTIETTAGGTFSGYAILQVYVD